MTMVLSTFLRRGGDEGGHNEDAHQQVLELLQEDLEPALLLALGELVGAVLLQPAPGLLVGQSLLVGLLRLQRLGYALL